MREELPHSDAAFSVIFEFGPVRRGRRVQREFILFDQLHHGSGCRDHLGEGSRIKDNILGHQRLVRLKGALFVCFPKQHPVSLTNQDYGTRNPAVFYSLIDNFRNRRE